MAGHTTRGAGTKDHEPGSGEVHRQKVEGEKTATGMDKETFGSGRAAQSEAGAKGAEIGGERSSQRSEEARKESARKAARTRAERYGDQLKISSEENDDLQGAQTTL